jgi:hypothetical protein
LLLTAKELQQLEDRTLMAGFGAAYVAGLYHDLLGRDADTAGQMFWTRQLDNGVPAAAVAQGIAGSPEFCQLLVGEQYDSFLHRPADSAGLNYFVHDLRAGPGTPGLMQVQTALLGSAEYFQARAGASQSGFLDALYADVLGRAIDPSGQAFFSAQLAQGATDTAVASAVVDSPEAQQILVQGLYDTLLHRPADAAGLAYWSGLLASGVRTEDVMAAVAASPEYATLQASSSAGTVGTSETFRAAGRIRPLIALPNVSVGNGGYVPVNADDDNGSVITNGIPAQRDFNVQPLPRADPDLIQATVSYTAGLRGRLKS